MEIPQDPCFEIIPGVSWGLLELSRGCPEISGAPVEALLGAVLGFLGAMMKKWDLVELHCALRIIYRRFFVFFGATPPLLLLF